MLSRVEHLDVSSNPLAIDGWNALVQSPQLVGLRSLAARGPSSPDGDGSRRDGDRQRSRAPAFAAAHFLPSLERLDLTMAELGPAGGHVLAVCALGRLRFLSLHGSALADDGAIALARAPWLGELRALDLGDNALTDAAAHALIASSARADLYLQLGGATLAKATQRELEARFGSVQLDHPWNRSRARTP